MAKQKEIYKCEVCGNIVEVHHGGEGELVCCGEPMKKMEPQTADFKNEKHVPMIEKTADGYKVTVGSTLHPMKEEHYIEWIELIVDGKSYRQYLKPGDDPIAEFCVKQGGNVWAREYCNVHLLWKGDTVS